MSDLTDIQASQSVKIAGANPSTGVESNFAQVDSAGSIYTTLKDSSGTSISTSTPLPVTEIQLGTVYSIDSTFSVSSGTTSIFLSIGTNPNGAKLKEIRISSTGCLKVTVVTRDTTNPSNISEYLGTHIVNEFSPEISFAKDYAAVIPFNHGINFTIINLSSETNFDCYVNTIFASL